MLKDINVQDNFIDLYIKVVKNIAEILNKKVRNIKQFLIDIKTNELWLHQDIDDLQLIISLNIFLLKNIAANKY